MAENPMDETAPAGWGELTIQAQHARRSTSTNTMLAQSHWIKVTFYRYYNYRESALAGTTDQDDTAIDTSETTATSTFYEHMPIPLHSSGEPFSEPMLASSRVWGSTKAEAQQVFVIESRDAGFKAGYMSDDRLVGTVTKVGTQKSLSQASGKFKIDAKIFAEIGSAASIQSRSVEAQLNLGEDNSIHKYIDSGDWVEINIVWADPRITDYDTNTFPVQQELTLMVGRVDTVTATINAAMSGGANVLHSGS